MSLLIVLVILLNYLIQKMKNFNEEIRDQKKLLKDYEKFFNEVLKKGNKEK